MYIGLNTAIVGQNNPSLTQIVSSLFSNGEQGVWYDPSDFSTMFQDSAGTTPVTSVEQPVGLMLDKSQGLVLGPELVTNGTFDTDTTGWTATGGAGLISGNGKLKINNDTANFGGTTQTIATAPGRVYVLIGNIEIGNTSVTFRARNESPTTVLVSQVINTTGTYRLYFVALSTATQIQVINGDSDLNDFSLIDNISVRELPGNHATQTTATSRPVLSARYNLLTKTEQFDDVAWTKFRCTILQNAIAAPDGMLTADATVQTTGQTTVGLIAQTVAGMAGSASIIISVFAKLKEKSFLVIGTDANNVVGNNRYSFFNLTTGAVSSSADGHTASITSVGSDWYLCKVTVTTRIGGGNVTALYGGTDASGYITVTDSGGIYIWGASLVPANQASLPYQRVNHRTDYDTQGFPLYLRFDGVDDWLVTPTVNFTSTDKMTVFAGVRKLTDTASGVFVELSADSWTTAGAFVLLSPSSSGANSYRFFSRGSNGPASSPGNGVFAAAPDTSTITCISNISGPEQTLRRNAGLVESSTASQGTGNYGNYPLYIGRRGGTTWPFNGHLYGLIVRGALSSTAEITSAESYMNTFTRAY